MLELARWQHLSTAKNVNTMGSRLGLGKSFHLIFVLKPTETIFKHFLHCFVYWAFQFILNAVYLRFNANAHNFGCNDEGLPRFRMRAEQHLIKKNKLQVLILLLIVNLASTFCLLNGWNLIVFIVGIIFIWLRKVLI